MNDEAPLEPGRIPPYSVRCVSVDAASEADGHFHVVGIETLDPDGGETHWSLVQVIAAYRDGGRFTAGTGQGGGTVELAPSVCPRCRLATLSPEPPTEGLELPRCS
jgi:hypothetical protein